MLIHTDFSQLRLWNVVLVIAFTFAPGNCNLDAQENTTPDQPKSLYDLKIELANINLRLAETELQLAEQHNRDVSSALPATATDQERKTMKLMKQISDSNMARLKSNVKIASEQLEQAVRPSTGSTEKIRKRYAEEKIRLAKVRLEIGRKAKADGLPVRDLEITRLELQHRLAQLKLELLGNPEHLLTVVDSLQRQIDRLSEELMAQDQRISAMEDR